ncbi:hypothetical protein M0811_05262 [Anaeramoeba ignava]|uniref:Uncharacterized protein n=1 Tax=Anaeramoeba ignava TaxID=1746090 RepID=A0A9Q0LPP7_ANAIG|nr:hypothetical protein M0811_06471 [Anaeramoeba ignava]KAJ5078005.1 hypothetical protein M0811_05262 [Anaeramoeba ignava]
MRFGSIAQISHKDKVLGTVSALSSNSWQLFLLSSLYFLCCIFGFFELYRIFKTSYKNKIKSKNSKKLNSKIFFFRVSIISVTFWLSLQRALLNLIQPTNFIYKSNYLINLFYLRLPLYLQFLE